MRWYERCRRGGQIRWLFEVYQFEQEGIAKIVNRTWMRTKSGRMLKRNAVWGCKRD